MSQPTKKRSFLERFVLRRRTPVQPVVVQAEDPAVTLARQTWEARAAELRQATEDVASLTRWADPQAGALANDLTDVTTKASTALYAQAGAALDTLKLAIAPLIGPARIKYYHDVAVAALRKKVQAAEAIVTENPATGTLPQDILAYTTAKAACTYTAGDQADVLSARRDAWLDAGNALVSSYVAANPGGDEDGPVGMAIRADTAPNRERAKFFQPRTLAQKRLKAAFMDQDSDNVGEWHAKGEAARALLNETTPPAAGEKKYVRRLIESEPHLTLASASAAPPTTMKPRFVSDYTDTYNKFVQHRNAWTIADGNLATGVDPERFNQALPLLSKANSSALILLSMHAEENHAEIEKIGKTFSNKTRTENAKAFVDGCDPTMLKLLGADDLISLLRSLRKDKSYKRDNKDLYNEAQDKLYKATRLDEDFLKHEATLRKDVIDELMKDKTELKAARDEWPSMDEPARLRILNKIVNAHCTKMGFEPPAAIEFYDAAPGNSGGYYPGANTIRINRAGRTVHDFELMIDTMFHENSHNWQVQLSKRIKGDLKPPIKKDDPLYKQALLFDVNEDDYTTGDAYDDQPQESHSFRAGPVSAKALMKALST